MSHKGNSKLQSCSLQSARYLSVNLHVFVSISNSPRHMRHMVTIPVLSFSPGVQYIIARAMCEVLLITFPKWRFR